MNIEERYKRPVGRKKSLPEGTKPKAIRMTETEYIKVVEYLKDIRESKKQ